MTCWMFCCVLSSLLCPFGTDWSELGQGVYTTASSASAAAVRRAAHVSDSRRRLNISQYVAIQTLCNSEQNKRQNHCTAANSTWRTLSLCSYWLGFLRIRMPELLYTFIPTKIHITYSFITRSLLSAPLMPSNRMFLLSSGCSAF